ncbi:Conserved oligomeric Golgi complex subunit 6 [Schistosoma japonicum]|nr:Conserved oligomeric Golgi complex subunit 6 [Schistosoma japonicum]
MDQNPLLIKIQRILNGIPDNEGLFLDGLNSIFPLVKNSCIPNQRTLRSSLEEIQFSNYVDLLLFFGDVKKRLDGLKTCVNNILETCLRMNGALNSVKSETVLLVDEAQKLESDSKLVAIKAYLLEQLVKSYQMSVDEAHTLSSKVNYMNDAFFSALSHGKEIKNMCRDCSLMNEVTEALNIAYENLYEWTQNECMNKVQETPEISLYLRRALSELQNKPVLLKYSLDEYVGARRKSSVKCLLDTLTVEVDLNYSVRDLSLHIVHPIHIRGKSHNPVRLVSDILACAHQIAASEKEYINSLCMDCHDTCTNVLHLIIIGDLKIICLDTITESLCSHLKVSLLIS